MGDTKHTPGPWRWFIQGNGDAYLATPDRGRLIVMDFQRQGMQGAEPRFRDLDICVMRSCLDWVSDRTAGTVEHPDALLIAAAPDLLEACQRALSLAQLLRSTNTISRADLAAANNLTADQLEESIGKALSGANK